jgi:hypothetical protein
MYFNMVQSVGEELMFNQLKLILQKLKSDSSYKLN